MKALNQAVEELRTHIENHATLALKVSSSDIGWHIDHCLIIISSVILAIRDSDTSRYKPTFSFKKLLVLGVGFIPRGKVRAPESVRPTMYDDISLREKTESVKNMLTTLDHLTENQYFKHPILGHINLKYTKRFLELHTHHNLKIINDILEK